MRQALGVKVIRSTRRKKSCAARVVGNVIEVRIPSWMTTQQESDAVADLVEKIERRRGTEMAGNDLSQRASELAKRFDLPQPTDIRWVTNQNSRWGSCTPTAGTIRISTRLADVPRWVLDYIVLHEMTHLVEANHGPRFKALMDRYPKGERAEGFLEAMSLGYRQAPPTLNGSGTDT